MIRFPRFFKDKPPAPKRPVLALPLQLIEPEELLQIHRTDIERLRIAWSETSTWERLFIPLLLRLAKVTQRLPYQAHGVFSDTDGLFRASVRSASFALDLMEESVQLERNIVSQELLQRRLKGAAAIASLCSFLHPLIDSIEITPVESAFRPFFKIDERHYVKHLSFNALAQPYYDWATRFLAEQPGTELTLSWKSQHLTRSPANDQMNLFLMTQVIPPAFLAWLSDAGHYPLMELMQCVSRSFLMANDSAVLRAKELAVFRACHLEREAIGKRIGERLAPAGWEDTLIRLIRARIAYDWEVNAKDSPLRLGADGLFLFWPDVAPILIDDLKRRGLAELTNDPDIWAGLLLGAGLTEPSRQKESVAFIAVTPNAKPRQAVKLSKTLFMGHVKVQSAKIPKRTFEVHVPLRQQAGLTRLTRSILKEANDGFTASAPETLTPKSPFEWCLNIPQNVDPGLTHALETILEELSLSDGKDVFIDEGLFLNEKRLTIPSSLDPTLSSDLFVKALHSAGLIYCTQKNEPAFFDHVTTESTIERGIILRSCVLGVKIKDSLYPYAKAFELLHRRKPQSALATEDTYQMALPLEKPE